MGSSSCLAPLEVILSHHFEVDSSLFRTTRPGSVRRRAKSSEGKEFNLYQPPTTPIFRREEGSAMQVNLEPPLSHLQVSISSPLSLLCLVTTFRHLYPVASVRIQCDTNGTALTSRP